MKRILALVLSLVICFTFCACGKKTETPPEPSENKGNGIDLDKVLSDGKIPELEVTLGMSPEQVEEIYNYDPEAVGETGIYLIPMRDYTYFLADTDSAFYYYKNDREDKGISYITSSGTACGLACGSYEKPEDVKNAFPSIKFTEGEATEEDLYAFPGAEGYTKLSYQKGSRIISFLFLDNELKAVNLIDLENWTDIND